MKGAECGLAEYMQGANKRFIIPVYQRNYDWKLENCKQLYDDLVKVIKTNRKTHFFGSIVSVYEPSGKNIEFLVIDGQQRLTTVSLLLLAMYNLIQKGVIVPQDDMLATRIYEEFLVDKYQKQETRIKLKPVKNDKKAFGKLFDADDEHIRGSNITNNYNYFYERIQKQEISIDELFDAICRLEIISIRLENDDNPQLIFESLNSTGLDLSEGDKIRNFILMGLPSQQQELYYEKYWNRIEEHTGYLYERDNEFTSEISTRILKDITLTAREDFMKAPAGFRKEDVYPWRFNRQYSFIRRPILCRGNDLIWGIRQLYHSLLYVTNLIYGGRLATTDKKMNTLMGRICNDQGDAFNQHISDIVKSFGVFKVFPNVKRINKKKIADEKGDVLGDIDVLIIDEKKHRIVVAEVKNFDFSKNPYEIHAEYQKMFLDGKKKSFATKHKRRVEWVIAHFDDVRAQYSLSRNKWTVHGVFITNEPLMSVNTYRKKLSVLSEAELSVESLRKIQ